MDDDFEDVFLEVKQAVTTDTSGDLRLARIHVCTKAMLNGILQRLCPRKKPKAARQTYSVNCMGDRQLRQTSAFSHNTIYTRCASDIPRTLHRDAADDDDDDDVDISFDPAPSAAAQTRMTWTRDGGSAPASASAPGAASLDPFKAAAAAAAAALGARKAAPISISLGGSSSRTSMGGQATTAASKQSTAQASVYEFDLDGVEDKPWNKKGAHRHHIALPCAHHPMVSTLLVTGADITDWFNYGFNEESWKAYCEKQKKLRQEYQMQSKIKVTCRRPLLAPAPAPPPFPPPPPADLFSGAYSHRYTKAPRRLLQPPHPLVHLAGLWAMARRHPPARMALERQEHICRETRGTRATTPGTRSIGHRPVTRPRGTQVTRHMATPPTLATAHRRGGRVDRRPAIPPTLATAHRRGGRVDHRRPGMAVVARHPVRSCF
jgi:hypothetical protein